MDDKMAEVGGHWRRRLARLLDLFDVPRTVAAWQFLRRNAAGTKFEWADAVPDASGDIRVSGDVYPQNDERGLMSRFVNPAAYTTHFRDGALPSGFSWVSDGTFTVPDGAIYVSGDYLRVTHSTAPIKHFLAMPTSGIKQHSKYMTLRVRTGSNRIAGLRIDNDSNNSYGEIVLDGSASDGSQTLKFRNCSGVVSTVTTTVVIPASDFLTIRLLAYNTGSAYYLYGYLVAEDGGLVNISGFAKDISPWLPPGRLGIVVESVSAANPAYIDWFYNDFTA